MFLQRDDVGFCRHFRPPSAVGAGIARQVDEFQHRAVGIEEIGARAVDDPALAVFLEGDLDAVSAQMVERRRVILMPDGKGMMPAAMALGHPDCRRIALRWPVSGTSCWSRSLLPRPPIISASSGWQLVRIPGSSGNRVIRFA